MSRAITHTQEKTNYPLPVIHSNGNTKEALSKQYKEAHNQLASFIHAWSGIEFHGRDYYVLDDNQSKLNYGESAFGDACRMRHKMQENLNELRQYVEDHLFHIDEQGN